MTFLTERNRNIQLRRTLIGGALGAVALGAAGAPASADVLGYYYAQPTYTYTEPANTYVAPAQAPTGTTTTVVTAPTAPPPARVEVIPPSPGPQMVWESGHWSFNGATWDWIPGHYEAAPQPTTQWIPGHWTQQPGGSWIWIAGYWTS